MIEQVIARYAHRLNSSFKEQVPFKLVFNSSDFYAKKQSNSYNIHIKKGASIDEAKQFLFHELIEVKVKNSLNLTNNVHFVVDLISQHLFNDYSTHLKDYFNDLDSLINYVKESEVVAKSPDNEETKLILEILSESSFTDLILREHDLSLSKELLDYCMGLKEYSQASPS